MEGYFDDPRVAGNTEVCMKYVYAIQLFISLITDLNRQIPTMKKIPIAPMSL